MSELDRLSFLLRRVSAYGVGVLLIEHNVGFVLALADTVTVLHEGRVVARGTSEEVRDDPEVARFSRKVPRWTGRRTLSPAERTIPGAPRPGRA